MGQQQLLLLVFGVVVVGIALIAGLQAFGEGRSRADRNSAVQRAMQIVADVQSWKLKPGILGGGAGHGAGDFSSLSFEALGYDIASPDAPYLAASGCYKLTGSTTGAVIEVYLGGAENGCDPSTRLGQVTVAGIKVKDVTWTY